MSVISGGIHHLYHINMENFGHVRHFGWNPTFIPYKYGKFWSCPLISAKQHVISGDYIIYAWYQVNSDQKLSTFPHATS